MNRNMGNMGRGDVLEHVANEIQEKGLPSVDKMRTVVGDRENEILLSKLANKIAEYKILFDKFKSRTATDEELLKMTVLSDELQTLQKRLGLVT
ncbi:MAG: hypothetical protein KBC21_01905 [Candidatus Pacebacteria bacterium]|nr:hypothetical protein [Candidatus Paceibacterota bacterium]